MGKYCPRTSKIDSPVIQSEECKFCVKKHNQPTFHETTAASTATNSLCIGELIYILEAAILSGAHAQLCMMGKICPFLSGPLQWMLSAWLSRVTMDPSAEACLWTEVLHTNLLLLSLINKLLSLGCQLKTYPDLDPLIMGHLAAI